MKPPFPLLFDRVLRSIASILAWIMIRVLPQKNLDHISASAQKHRSQTLSYGLNLLRQCRLHSQGELWKQVCRDVLSTIVHSHSPPFHGIMIERDSSDEYAQRIVCTGSIYGSQPTDRFVIRVGLCIDSERVRPVFLYFFEVLDATARFCRVVAYFQSPEEYPETNSNDFFKTADIRLDGQDAAGLVALFHHLTGEPMHPEFLMGSVLMS